MPKPFSMSHLSWASWPMISRNLRRLCLKLVRIVSQVPWVQILQVPTNLPIFPFRQYLPRTPMDQANAASYRTFRSWFSCHEAVRMFLKPVMLWIMTPLDLISAQVFCPIYDATCFCSYVEEDIRNLLEMLEFWPLRRILANAAHHSSWFLAVVQKNINGTIATARYSTTTRETLSLSFSSPSIQSLGGDDRRALTVIVSCHMVWLG